MGKLIRSWSEGNYEYGVVKENFKLKKSSLGDIERRVVVDVYSYVYRVFFDV